MINSILKFFLLLSGEMSSMYPVSGAFSTFGTRFVSPALGFTLGEFMFQSYYFWNKYEIILMIGWNYWLQW